MADLIGPVMRRLVEDTRLALAAEDREPQRVVPIAPGLVPAWDECECGYLYGRVLTITPFTGQQGRNNGMPCGVLYWVAEVAIAVVRCATGPDDNGKSPDAALVTSDGQEMLDDLAAVEQVIRCSEYTRSIIQWSPMAEEGGCHGGEWRFTIRYDACGCPAPEPAEA